MKPAESSRRWIAVVAGIIGVVATVSYPLLVFYGLTRYGPRAVAGVLLVALVPLTVARLARSRRAHLRQVGFVPILVIGLVAASAILGRAGLMLLVPVVINGVLAASFGATLKTSSPMIERFARLEHPDLIPGEVAWCRLWTQIWTAFFLINCVIVLALVLTERLSWWMYYTGLIAYLLMGMLFASEYVVRKARFGRFAAHPADRLLGWALRRIGIRPPPPPTNKAESNP